MHFIVLWIPYLFFLLLCILLFYDFCCLRSSFGSISSWINDIFIKQKEDKITDLQSKIHFAICFVHKMKKISLLGVEVWLQKVMWLRQVRSDFHKRGVKVSARLQRKKSWSGAAESAAVVWAWQNVSGGGDPTSPPPHAIRIKANWVINELYEF